MQRRAWLDSDQFDLERVAEHLAHGDVKVAREGDEFYLTSPDIDSAVDDQVANDVAMRLISRINALGQISDRNFRPLKLARYTNSQGQAMIFGVMSASMVTLRAHATAIVTRADGTVAPVPPSPWSDYLVLADTNSDVREALNIISRTQHFNWDDLWKLYEIIREAVKSNTIVGLGWISADDLNSFRESSNHPDVSGASARHARRPEQPRYRAMPLDEGSALIRGVVLKWLNRLTGRG